MQNFLSKKTTTIFRQLVFNVVIPVLVALFILALLNYFNTKKILVESNQVKNNIITTQIQHILELQDVTLDLIESRMAEQMTTLSQTLIDKYLNNVKNVETIDLDKIRKELNMDPLIQDIYLINKNGIVVNTTFKDDLNLNFFSFGEDHKKMLQGIFAKKKFVSERFAIEAKTRRLKKYSYQTTNDGEYILELGFYSNQADDIIDFIRSTLRNIANKQANIVAVDLFIGKDNPFSLNKDAILKEEHKKLLKNVFTEQDTTSIEEYENGRFLHNQYIFMPRHKTDLYKGSVIRITTDRTAEKRFLRNELIKLIVIFSLIILVVCITIYKKTKVITDPIKRLVSNVNRIRSGHMGERAEVIGNNEITVLSEQFNYMIEELESYYNELEEKVRERTLQISQQKEEIERQKQNITDSINYARNIQTALLPPREYLSKFLREYFILFKPRDIVSGDFYWMSYKNDKLVIAAVDCTGHGVPGAFMSMLGNAFLNETVNHLGIIEPEKTLEALRASVIRSLHQTGKKGEAQDGMDIALVVLDKETNTLEFAGAHNPLFIISNNELQVFKGDNIPISFDPYCKDHNFERKSMQLKTGDMIYIFSDGYTDQFGGPENRKFGSKRFKEFLLSIHMLPMYEQEKKLFDNLEAWKGEKTQVDDILVIGLQI